MKPFSFVFPIFWCIFLLLFLVTTLNSIWSVPTTSGHALGNETDHLALLKFKESVSGDPYGVLNSWNTSTHFCNWHGITCGQMHQRVTQLNLEGYQLHGSISPQLGNLSFLRYIKLQNNSFYGKIPQELGRLPRLQILYLRHNSLTGEILTNLTSCTNIRGFDFSWNNLIGKIPIEIGSLWKLKELFIERNNFTGQIPASIGNLSSLTHLIVGENNLEGNIPQEVSQLKNLTHLVLGSNKFSGTLPSGLYNMSSLIEFAVQLNQFNGSLPPNMFQNLPMLQLFLIGGNNFSSNIPSSITNASLLQAFDFSRNHFVGQVPSLWKLNKLHILDVSFNSLGGDPTKDLEFMKSLINCSNLDAISISVNSFGGQLPNNLGNLSAHLSKLYIGNNQIYGKIPAELGNMVNLILLAMQYNHFDGIIPVTFAKFQKMEALVLSGNKLSGDIPAFIGNLKQIYKLSLSENMFEGIIPPSIGNCQNLQYLDLSKNRLRGTITSKVFSIPSLSLILDLSQNSFSGSLPDEVGNLKNIDLLDVSENHLSGEIPESIGGCLSLEYLYLHGNSFDGIIPSSLILLRGLEEVDLSRNHLSGSIPEGLKNLMFLEYLNVSYNMLDGEVPTEGVFANASKLSVIGNTNLCGGILELHLPPCLVKDRKTANHHHRLIFVIVSVVASLLIISFTLTIFWMKKRNKKPTSDSPPPTIDQMAKVSYQNLHHGTDGFSARNLIGSGNFGSVYKGTLDSEDRIVAIKVFNLQKKAAEKSFIAECSALKNIRHRNLVKILTCCSSQDYRGQEFKALVFEFMANGSLESWLHPETEVAAQPRLLDLEQRLNVINDVASAFHYLHYECEQAIIHCDLKPSNILLDDCMVAHVSDFGLARLLSTIGVSTAQSITIGIKGTIGYTPPEYGMGLEASTEGDMYSFGILILEILTGRRPTEEMFEDGHDLHNYVKMSIPNHMLQIIDPNIFSKELDKAGGNKNLGLMHPDVENCLLLLFKIALACSVKSPKERMNMVDATRELNLIKSSFPSDKLNGSSLHYNRDTHKREDAETSHLFKFKSSTYHDFGSST